MRDQQLLKGPTHIRAATITRTEVAFTAAEVSEFLQKNLSYHRGAVDRKLSDLNGTKTPAIKCIGKSNKIFSFANDSVSRRKTEGQLF